MELWNQKLIKMRWKKQKSTRKLWKVHKETVKWGFYEEHVRNER